MNACACCATLLLLLAAGGCDEASGDPMDGGAGDGGTRDAGAVDGGSDAASDAAAVDAGPQLVMFVGEWGSRGTEPGQWFILLRLGQTHPPINMRQNPLKSR